MSRVVRAERGRPATKKSANKTVATPHAWEIRSFDDVKQFWSGVRSVPRRTRGRQHWHEERYYIGLYLLALGMHGSLSYPFHIEQGESPDFVFTWPSGEVTGLEVTKMTTQWLQRAMTADEREYLSRETEAAASGSQAEPVVRSLDDGVGMLGDEAEVAWCRLLKEAVERKLDKLSGFRPACRYDLLIADDGPIGGVERHKIVAMLQPWVRGLDTSVLGTISVVISLDVLFDLRGCTRLLPYVDWTAPQLDRPGEPNDLSDRLEYAGWHAANQAIRRHAEQRIPVYSMDSRGRLVKHLPNGQRFEMQVDKDGAEAVVKRLSPK